MKRRLFIISAITITFVLLGTSISARTVTMCLSENNRPIEYEVQSGQQNSNKSVKIVGNKYMTKIPFKELWNMAMEENKDAEKNLETKKKEMTKEERERFELLLEAMDCYMYVTIRSESKMILSIKVSMNKERGKAAGLNAVQRATFGTLFKVAGGSESIKYIRKGEFLYDVSEPEDEEPMEILNDGESLRVKDSEFKKTFVLKLVK